MLQMQPYNYPPICSTICISSAKSNDGQGAAIRFIKVQQLKLLLR